jgi:hypothetical protein
LPARDITYDNLNSQFTPLSAYPYAFVAFLNAQRSLAIRTFPAHLPHRKQKSRLRKTLKRLDSDQLFLVGARGFEPPTT